MNEAKSHLLRLSNSDDRQRVKRVSTNNRTTEMNKGMIIYDAIQSEAVNLANVDTIVPGEFGGGFVIYFNRAFLHEGTEKSRLIARWDYKTKEDRDNIFDRIIREFGARFSDDILYPT